jgi:hypothetical protein
MECLSLLGFGVATTDSSVHSRLPFPSTDIDREAIPPPLRRRTSQATQLAFSAASAACRMAGRLPAELPAVFASVGGELKLTDGLCIELARTNGVISPTAFHNSVQNTAAAYWSIAHGCAEAASAVAAGHDTFAMALLETWCQLRADGGARLLVCYDESWPEYLAPPMGTPPLAVAMVLTENCGEGALALLGMPYQGAANRHRADFDALLATAPVAAGLALLAEISAGGGRRIVSLGLDEKGWAVPVET